MCDEKFRAFAEEERDGSSRKRERGVREQLREDEREYVGLVLRARTKNERRESAREGEMNGEREKEERSAAMVLLLSFNPAAFL